MPPPPACPEGQHLNGEGECQDDYECGDDEIGGGAVPCEPCGEGLVPDHDGTACKTCPHGESGTAGLCAADPCGLDALDFEATEALGAIPKEPRERGRAFYCLDDEIGATAWSYSSGNACAVSFDMRYWDSCWVPGGRDGPCDLASAHTHPYFTKADEGKKCQGQKIDEDLAKKYNNAGMEFSSTDLFRDRDWRVDGYLGVSDRSCAKANRIYSGGVPTVVAGMCTPVPLPHAPWSTP